MTTTLDDPDILHDTPTNNLTTIASYMAGLAETTCAAPPTSASSLVHETSICSKLQEARARLDRAYNLATYWERCTPTLDVHPYAQQVRAHAYALRQALGVRQALGAR